MQKVGATIVLGFGLIASSIIVTPTQAMPVTQLAVAASQVTPFEKTQFIFGGRHYCFYLSGWHGPGWYWCGYASRRGLGWGGPRGWHGWRTGPSAARPGHGTIGHGRGGHSPGGHGPSGHGPAGHGSRGPGKH